MNALSGKDSTGRPVSLLEDSLAPLPQLFRIPSTTPSLQSWTSSYSSSALAPLPYSIRGDSSDSSDMLAPSLVMSNFSDELGVDSDVPSQDDFFVPRKDLSFPVHQLSDPLPYHISDSRPGHCWPDQMFEKHPESTTPSTHPKKKSYPCPMAKQLGCNGFFTTSDHATRHAKKHTGERSALCPECNRAFIRKDSMEQHRRVHQYGRNAVKGGDNDVKKARYQAKQPRPEPINRQCLLCRHFPWLTRRFPLASPDPQWHPPCTLPMSCSTSLPALNLLNPPTTATIPPLPSTVSWMYYR